MKSKKTTERKSGAAVRVERIVGPLLSIGEEMSNILYALCRDERLERKTRILMDQKYRIWDDARRTCELEIRKWPNNS